MNDQDKIDYVIKHSVPVDEMYFKFYYNLMECILQLPMDVRKRLNKNIERNMVNQLYYECLIATKPMAYQSIVMKIGLGNGLVGEEAFNLASDFIIQSRNLGLYTIKHGKGLSVHSRFRLERKHRDKIDAPDYDWVNPKRKTKNSKLILGKGNAHKYKQAVDVLNILQSIEFEIDTDVLLNFRDDPQFDTEEANKIVSRLVGKPFRFGWEYDKRGRSYSIGYEVNLQSNEYKKALLSLHNKEVVK